MMVTGWSIRLEHDPEENHHYCVLLICSSLLSISTIDWNEVKMSFPVLFIDSPLGARRILTNTYTHIFKYIYYMYILIQLTQLMVFFLSVVQLPILKMRFLVSHVRVF